MIVEYNAAEQGAIERPSVALVESASDQMLHVTLLEPVSVDEKIYRVRGRVMVATVDGLTIAEPQTGVVVEPAELAHLVAAIRTAQEPKRVRLA